MAIITFTSDFGTRDHYVAAVKAKIFNYNANIQVIDISHNVDHYNVAHGAFILNSVFRDFPKGTVHLVAINSLNENTDKYIAARMEDHFFVGTDNGFFSLLSEKPTIAVEILFDKNLNQTFPEKNIFAFAAVSLASGKNLYDLGPTINSATLKRMVGRKLKSNRNSIEGNVLHTDHYGNAITNISKKLFDETAQGRASIISFGRENVETMHAIYHQAENGDCVALFNDLGLLEIAIKNGNASQLLGLQYDSPVRVNFAPELV
ncbi:MAG: S-adenosyl-l-methionine hydroxide adenosyltransferase family protein [Cytophagales bacterium]